MLLPQDHETITDVCQEDDCASTVSIDEPEVDALAPLAFILKIEDLDALMLLIHERKAYLVGALLLAYGYARAPKVETTQPK